MNFDTALLAFGIASLDDWGYITNRTVYSRDLDSENLIDPFEED